MAGTIKLTPAQLMAQADEMRSLEQDYEALFKGVTNELNSINGNWSRNLAHNFEGKITSAQRAFSHITSLLNKGATAAANSAKTFETVDSQLSKMMNGEVTSKDRANTYTAGGGGKGAFGGGGGGGGFRGENGKEKSFLDEIEEKGDAAIREGKKIISKVKKEYNKKGNFYKTVEYAKCGGKLIKGVVKLGGSLVAIATGGGIPLGMVAGISAGSDITDAITDFVYISNGQYDEVGESNALKDYLVDTTSEIGAQYGYEEAGGKVGETISHGVDLVSFLDDADDMLKSMGDADVAFTNTEHYSNIFGEVTSFDIVLEKPTGEIYTDAAKSVYDGIKSGYEYGEKLSEYTSAMAE